jgi:hypothetical protein
MIDELDDDECTPSNGILMLIVAKNKNGKMGISYFKRNENFTEFNSIQKPGDSFEFNQDRLSELQKPLFKELNNENEVLIISNSEVEEILNNVKTLYNMSQIYLNNIIGEYIENNKIKILDNSILEEDEISIIGELQIIHLQNGITKLIDRVVMDPNKVLNGESKKLTEKYFSIINKATSLVFKYSSIDELPSEFKKSEKFLKSYYDDLKISKEFYCLFLCFFLNIIK